MIKLSRPPHSASSAFRLCASGVRSRGLRRRLESVERSVERASEEFEVAATSNRLFQLSQHRIVGGAVTRKEMEDLYSFRMARPGSAGYGIYASILSLAPLERCPLCGHGRASTLDHHLPKSKFPSLAVAPLNLLPACSDCNAAKRSAIPLVPEDETLHPYFDDLGSHQWLRAQILESAPAVAKFFVEPGPDWSPTLAARVQKHFSLFRLARLYSSEAANELSGIADNVQRLFESGGPELVRLELGAQARSRVRSRINSWQSATYRALVESEWYCAGGFVQRRVEYPR